MITMLASVALRVSALLLLTALAVRLLRDQSAGRRHFVMVLGALGALSIPVLTLFAPRWDVPVLPASATTAAAPGALRAAVPAHVRSEGAQRVRPPLVPVAPSGRGGAWGTRQATPAPSVGGAFSGEGMTAAGVDARVRAGAAVAVSPATRARPAMRGGATEAPWSALAALASLTSWRPSAVLQLSLAWLFGVSLLVGQLGLGVMRRARLARTATDLLPAPWERARARLRARGLLPERVRLYATPRSSMPMTWGIVRPIVLLPERCDWTNDERDAALLHELAHVRRGDALWLTVLSLVRALHWYNPLAWWLCAAERLAREEACDDRVLEAGIRPSAYAEQLLGIVRHPNEWRTPAAALAMARPASLALRLRSILRAEQRRDLPGVATRACGVAVVTLLAACIGTASPARRAATTSPPDAPRARADRRAGSASAGAAGAYSPRGSIGAGSSVSAVAPAEGRNAASSDAASDVAAASAMAASGAGASASAASAASASDAEAHAAVAWGASAFGAGTAGMASEARSGGSASGVLEALAARGGRAAGGAAPAAGNWYAYDLSTAATLPGARQQDCVGARSRKSSTSRSINGEGRTETISWSRNGCKIEVTARGEYQLAPSLDDLRALSRGGSFVLREDDGRIEREVRITSGADGTLEHRYRVDGETRPWDSEGKAWFAQVALRLDRATGWAVDVRFPALMSRGGVDAVLAEIDLLEGDYARRLYFTRLASSAQLSSAQLVRVIDSAAAKIHSDYEMAELLIAASKQKAFDDPAQLSLARAASRIKSDYEKRRAFTALLSKDGLSPATVGEILAGTKGMDSDYELAELLIDVASRYAMAPATRGSYMDALGTIESDYEYRRVVTALAKRAPLPAEFTREILSHAATHVKGFELAELLISMDKSIGKDRAMALSLLEAASHLDSDYEHGRVLKDLIAQGPDAQVVVQLLKQTPRVGSAYERAEVLLAVARAYRLEGALHDSYVDAARSIDSDYERNRALAAAVGRRVER